MIVSVKNLTSKEITLKAGTIIGKIEAANAVPPMLDPKPKSDKKVNPNSNAKLNENESELTTTMDSNSSEKCKLTTEEIELLMSKVDLSGIKTWSPRRTISERPYYRVWVSFCIKRHGPRKD